MVGELDFERAVVLEFGRSGSGDLVSLVEAGPGEEDQRPGVFEVEAGLHGCEGDLAVAVGLDDDHGRLGQVEMVAVPYIGLDDPPPADQLTVHGCAHGGASASSLGSRTRL